MNKMNMRLLFLIEIIFVVSLIASSVSDGAEFTVRPSIDLIQEYNDNIYLSRDFRKSDYISRVLPSIAMNYKAPFWEWQFDYALNWWYYHKLAKSFDSHRLNLTSKLNIIDNFLYLDITDNYSNVALNERRASNEGNLNFNRTDTNNFTVSPYIKYRITPVVTLTTGYRYTNIWYREDAGINRQMHTGYATIERVFSPQFNIAIGAEYTADRPESPETDNNQALMFVKAVYVLSPRTNLEGSIGYRQIDFSKGNDESSPYYNFKILHRFHEHGEIELGISSEIAVTVVYGVQESLREQLTIRYGEVFKIIGSVFHQKNKSLDEETAQDVVLEKDFKDDIVGLTAGFEYRPNPLLTFRASGGYQKNSHSFERYNDKITKLKYEHEDEVREVYTASAGADYRLTEKITLGLTYSHTRENGRTNIEDYKNNIIAAKLRINI